MSKKFNGLDEFKWKEKKRRDLEARIADLRDNKLRQYYTLFNKYDENPETDDKAFEVNDWIKQKI